MLSLLKRTHRAHRNGRCTRRLSTKGSKDVILKGKAPVTAQESLDVVDQLRAELQVAHPDDWYRALTRKSFSLVPNGARVLDSHDKLLSSVLNSTLGKCSNHQWLEWEFKNSRVPRGFWKKMDNRKSALDALAVKLGVTTKEQWYSKTGADFLKYLGPLFVELGSSHIKLLKSTYPDHKWEEWRFETASRNFWSDLANQKRFLDSIKPVLKINTNEDWYKVDFRTLGKHGGRSLMNIYNNSLCRLFSTIYPEHDWEEWRFGHVPAGFWKEVKNQKHFLDTYTKRNGIVKMEEWYNVDRSTMITSAPTLMKHHKGSLVSLLKTVYPNHEWHEWRFQMAPLRFWSSTENVKRFFDFVGQECGVVRMEDWYQVNRKRVIELGGGRLWTRDRDVHLVDLLRRVYPNHDWLPWKFAKLPAGFWSSPANARAFVEWMGRQLGVSTLDDWYKITMSDLQAVGDRSIFNIVAKDSSMITLLKTVYPDHNWQDFRFSPRLVHEL